MLLRLVKLLGSSNSDLASKVAGPTGGCHHTQVFSVLYIHFFCVGIGFGVNMHLGYHFLYKPSQVFP